MSLADSLISAIYRRYILPMRLDYRSRAEVETLYYSGVVTEQQWQAFQVLSYWLAPRHSACWPQERLYRRRGWDALLARINRVRRACGLVELT